MAARTCKAGRVSTVIVFISFSSVNTQAQRSEVACLRPQKPDDEFTYSISWASGKSWGHCSNLVLKPLSQCCSHILNHGKFFDTRILGKQLCNIHVCVLSAKPTSKSGSLDEDVFTLFVRDLKHLLNITELQDKHLLEMLLPLAYSSTQSLNPFSLHTQGYTWVSCPQQQSPGNSVLSWLNQTLQPYLLPTSLGSAFSCIAGIAHPQAQHTWLSHS